MTRSKIEKELLALKENAESLEPAGDKRKMYLDAFKSYAEKFYSSINSQKAYVQHSKEDISKILNSHLQEESGELDDILELIDENVIPPGLNPVSGKHFGYIPGGGIFSSALGDYLSALTNRYSGVFYASPGAVALENRLIRWMAELIGYTGNYGGYLSSGGSMANLTAIYSAREAANITSKDIPDTVVYLSDQTHHCVAKALKICGLQECIKRYVPLNNQFQMKEEELREMILSDLDDGLNPWMIVASAGTTDLGVIDPIKQIGEIAKEFNIWYHVDAAYGGFFLLTEMVKKRLEGISQADSVVLDPHKGLFLPYGTGALIVKDIQTLIKSNEYSANYMQDTKATTDKLYSPAEVSPELSRHFRGLRMWLPLKLHGIDAFRNALNEKLLLTEYLWNWLRDIPNMAVSNKPDLTTILFRWEPDKTTLKSSAQNLNYDELNQKIHKALLSKGDVFFSTTRIEDKHWLRLTVLSVRTHLDEVKAFQKELMGCLKQFQQN